MRQYKKGDKIYIFQKLREWVGGRDEEKDKAFKERIILTVREQDGDRVITEDKYSDCLTLWEDCVRPANKPTVLICSGDK